ncbi:putative protein N(5)-glutamine methyltransferase [Nonomuraea sediminis]|uniref:putative protein N(5)-glutamine methyltransferase n=1 Tax=Nonomuraea sediminis TaxID=2835864 RepID=UPI001BDD0240|nr:putative protein N(5)-glutamine methyltransferase [Nonomuraea sediminis]
MSIVSRLRAAGCVFAEEEAELLVSAATGPDELDAMVERRVAGFPLEQVLGWAEFCGLRITVEPGVFVPRRRSEFLVAQAVSRGGSTIVDLCCGTGAIGLAISKGLPGSRVYAADIDPAAVRCARRNLTHVYEGDLFEALPGELRGNVDLLVVSPPYVPTEAIALLPAEAREHEPRSALDGGADGLDLVRRVAAEAGTWLSDGGGLLVEMSERQAGEAAGLVRAAGLAAEVRLDEELGATVVTGTYHATHVE